MIFQSNYINLHSFHNCKGISLVHIITNTCYYCLIFSHSDVREVLSCALVSNSLFSGEIENYIDWPFVFLFCIQVFSVFTMQLFVFFLLYRRCLHILEAIHLGICNTHICHHCGVPAMSLKANIFLSIKKLLKYLESRYCGDRAWQMVCFYS